MCHCCWPPTGGGWPSGTGDLDVGALRQRYAPEQLTGYLACWAGLLDRPESVRPRELISSFSWGKVPRADIHLDGTEFL